jgi:hypothetical protein
MAAAMSDSDDEQPEYYEDEVHSKLYGDPSLSGGGDEGAPGSVDGRDDGSYSRGARAKAEEGGGGGTSSTPAGAHETVVDAVPTHVAAMPPPPPRLPTKPNTTTTTATTTATATAASAGGATVGDDETRLAARVATFTKNGGRDVTGVDVAGVGTSPASGGDGYLWSQERDEVVISVIVPPGTKAKDVAVRCTKTSLEVAVAVVSKGGVHCGQSLLSGDLAHPIDPEPREDDEDVDAMDVGGGRVFGDWELTDFEPHSLGGRRAVRVTLRKKGLNPKP